MKRITWLVITTVAIITSAALISCDKSDESPISLNGRYMGSFSRTGMDTSEVTLLFVNNTYSGQSNRTNYPAICRGSFDVDDNTIQFADSCSWTANFDWSLILSGQYSISYNDGAVRIWKTNGTVTDEYLLRPVTR
jgi:hypothetical protein